MGYIVKAPEEIQGNVFSMIGSDWMLVTAGDNEKYNTMTASWGGMGVLWGKPAAFVFIRPQRYTYTFLEKTDRFTLSFFGEESGIFLEKSSLGGLLVTLRMDMSVLL